MPAGEMRVGDRVQSLQGTWCRVVSITPLPGQETVYNFTVDQNHDYFVGETGFLVHNAGCECENGPDGEPQEDLHHIVARNHPRAARARVVLDAAGIDLNDVMNLVPLLRCFHQHLHTTEYFDAVNDILEEAGPEGAEGALTNIGNQLGNGVWVPQ